ncbi:MAG: glycosyltransferase family 4 protein [Micrococcales bacterium]
MPKLHIAIFTDQNPGSLGGSQASVMLQKKFLEHAGHKVTVIAPQGDNPPAPGIITYPSLPLTPNREFAFTFRVFRSLKIAEHKLANQKTKVDLVHIQADNWGAIIGNLFGTRHKLPIVNTMHTNLDYALRKLLGPIFSPVTCWVLSLAYQSSGLPNGKVTTNPWVYLRSITSNAQVILSPSQHFANLAMKNGVAEVIDVLPNGVDDKFVNLDLDLPPKPKHEPGSAVTFIWSGRINPEKRIMVFLQAAKLANLNASYKIYGSGTQLEEAERFVEQHKLDDQVKFMGRLTHNDMLLEMRNADVLVQTSVGFETQGMTVYEAGVMGTPSVICDHNIAGDIPEDSYWLVKDESVEALADAIKIAAQDVEQNRSKHIDLRRSMLQSKITELQLAYYDRAIKLHQAK